MLVSRPSEWQIIDIALQSYDKVSVSLYDTLGKDSVGMVLFNCPNISLTHTPRIHVTFLPH